MDIDQRGAMEAESGAPVLDLLTACAPQGLAAPLSRDRAHDLAHLLKALADPARLRLVSLIRSAPAEEACVCDLTEALGLSQPTVSHHLKVLTEAGILDRERRGTWAWYSVVPGVLDGLGAVLGAEHS